MKKTVVYLGLALGIFSNVSAASNVNSLPTAKIITAVDEGVSPLCLAVIKGDMEAVKKLVEYGSDLNEESNEMTPLMFAARYNRIEILKYLVSKGANIKLKNSKGFNALKYAELSNATEVVQYLHQV